MAPILAVRCGTGLVGGGRWWGIEGGGGAGGGGPGVGVAVEVRVDEVGFGAALAAAGGRVRFDLVDASGDAADPALVDLVAHRIGEGLGRGGTGDHVPVVVEVDVQRPEREATVLAEDGPAAGAEVSSPERDRFGVGRRHRELVCVGRTAAAAVRCWGPQGVARLVEALEHLETLGGQCRELLVGVGELQAEQVALRLELDPVLARDVLGLAERSVPAPVEPLFALRP
jgi:hypothetical protein